LGKEKTRLQKELETVTGQRMDIVKKQRTVLKGLLPARNAWIETYTDYRFVVPD
jgi:hypothetical protein